MSYRYYRYLDKHYYRRLFEESLLLLAYHIVQRTARICPKPCILRLAREFDRCREEA